MRPKNTGKRVNMAPPSLTRGEFIGKIIPDTKKASNLLFWGVLLVLFGLFWMFQGNAEWGSSGIFAVGLALTYISGGVALLYIRKIQLERQDIESSPASKKFVAEEYITIALIMALISGVGTILISLAGFQGVDVWNLADAAIVFGLAFGMYKKSRVCAVFLLLYYLYNRYLLWIDFQDIKLFINITVILFSAGYILGLIGTFRYHRCLKMNKNS